MDIFHAVAYGFIQGMTEFLPVSSSAHLTLLPFFTGWQDPGLAFDVALHWGTLAAVFIYFRKDVLHLIQSFIGSLKGGRTPEHLLPWKIAIATVPGAALGFIFEKQAESLFRSPVLLACTLSVMGAALWAADRWGRKDTGIESLSFGKAVLIGIAQGIAIVPGVSRSGITIATGLLLGLDRESAVRFSFLLSMPITLGAGLLKSKYLIHNAGDPGILIGIVSSGLFGFAAIHILITYVRSRSFTPFVIYRFALAAAVLIMLGSRP